jgi:HEAT repeat protein
MRVRLLDQYGQGAPLSVLFRALMKDEECEVRAAAAQALGARRDPTLVPLFLVSLQGETDESVQEALMAALGTCQTHRGWHTLTQVVQDQHRNWLVRLAAVRAIGAFGATASEGLLLQVFRGDPETLVRQAAAHILLKQEHRNALERN